MQQWSQVGGSNKIISIWDPLSPLKAGTMAELKELLLSFFKAKAPEGWIVGASSLCGCKKGSKMFGSLKDLFSLSSVEWLEPQPLAPLVYYWCLYRSSLMRASKPKMEPSNEDGTYISLTKFDSSWHPCLFMQHFISWLNCMLPQMRSTVSLFHNFPVDPSLVTVFFPVFHAIFLPASCLHVVVLVLCHPLPSGLQDSGTPLRSIPAPLLFPFLPSSTRCQYLPLWGL